MKIAVITAGGAGMFCGSCMQDNTLVRTLRRAGADALLVPTYTPIRVDEENVSSRRVFLGGINVYLDSVLPGWKRLPAALTRWLNRPGMIRLLTRFGGRTEASRLGALTIDLLQGSAGPQRREIDELVAYLCDDLRPDLILFSNALLSGIVPSLRARFRGPLLTLLQGDDVFLEALDPRYRSQAVELVSRNCRNFDGLLTHSDYYSRFMQSYLSLPAAGFRRIPLTIDGEANLPADVPGDERDGGSRNEERFRSDRPGRREFTVGYFARICPEKGAHAFLDAAAALLPVSDEFRFTIAGYLPEQHHRWFSEMFEALRLRHGAERLCWAGSPASREEKFRILRSFDVLCVPTIYREPKGLYVLEAGLCGVPSVLPNHGAFPERLEALGYGTLFRPDVPGDLERTLTDLARQFRSLPEQSGHPEFRDGETLRQRVIDLHGMDATAPLLLNVLQEFVGARPSSGAAK